MGRQGTKRMGSDSHCPPNSLQWKKDTAVQWQRCRRKTSSWPTTTLHHFSCLFSEQDVSWDTFVKLHLLYSKYKVKPRGIWLCIDGIWKFGSFFSSVWSIWKDFVLFNCLFSFTQIKKVKHDESTWLVMFLRPCFYSELVCSPLEICDNTHLNLTRWLFSFVHSLSFIYPWLRHMLHCFVYMLSSGCSST